MAAEAPRARLRSDSPTARRIVLAFLDFLRSVDLSPDADAEALEVSRDCLQSVFGLDSSSTEQGIQPGLLVELFSSLQAGLQNDMRSGQVSGAALETASPSTSITQSRRESRYPKDPKDVRTCQDITADLSGDEVFARLYAGLDKINFFKNSSDGVDDPSQIEKAAQLLDAAMQELQNSGKTTPSLYDVSEFFKSKGNQLMQSKQYLEAIELYTFAIALHGSNAVYYCNRAAAYTHLHRYSEAIDDCMKSIEIDPQYSKAYSRLGSAYFALGNYHDALYKGYVKACQLDPGNQANQENAEVTRKRLREQEQRSEEQQGHPQFMGSTNGGASFASFPAGAPVNPEVIANVLRGVTSGISQQSGSQSMPSSSSATFSAFSSNGSIDLTNILGSMNFTPGPDAQASSANDGTPPYASFPTNVPFPPQFANIFASTTGGNGHGGQPGGPANHADAHVNLGDAPEQVANALRSVMQMFTPQSGSQDNIPRGQDHS